MNKHLFRAGVYFILASILSFTFGYNLSQGVKKEAVERGFAEYDKTGKWQWRIKK